MAANQAALRSLTHGVQVCVAGLGLMCVGGIAAYSFTLHGSYGIAMNVMKDSSRPPPDATVEEFNLWYNEHQRPVNEAAHRSAVAFVWITVVCVGVPAALSLLITLVILLRLRRRLLRG